MTTPATGACEPTFSAAGGHFDAGPAKNSTPPDTNHPYHLGDVPELEVRGRAARMHGVTTRFVLQPDHATTTEAGGSPEAYASRA
jgi:Cu-Zn family superoxide dismutase